MCSWQPAQKLMSVCGLWSLGMPGIPVRLPAGRISVSFCLNISRTERRMSR